MTRHLRRLALLAFASLSLCGSQTFKAPSRAGFTPSLESFVYEDWDTTEATACAGNLNWTNAVSGTGASNGIIASTSGLHPGLCQGTTGTTTTGSASLRGHSSAILLDANTYQELEWELQVPTLCDVTNQCIIRVGFCDSSSADCSNGVYFQYDNGTDGDFWDLKTANGGVRTKSVSTQAVVAGTWYRLKIAVTGNSSASFYVNGALVGVSSGSNPITTNMPTSTMGYLYSVIKSAGTTARTVQLDFFYVYRKYNTQR